MIISEFKPLTQSRLVRQNAVIVSSLKQYHGRGDVRFGSEADMASQIRNVCFTSESRHQALMSTRLATQHRPLIPAKAGIHVF
jgi:hypothetical protein